MLLLVDTISQPAAFVFFNEGREVVLTEREAMSGKEFERFLARITESCEKLGIEPKDLEGIVCVRGPAGFTGIRVVTLTLGTLAFAAGVPLFEIDYAELQAAAGWTAGVLLRANRDEVAYSRESGAGFAVVKKSEIPDGEYCGVAEESDFADRAVSVKSETDYGRAVKAFDLSHPKKRVEPFYVKKPHIT